MEDADDAAATKKTALELIFIVVDKPGEGKRFISVWDLSFRLFVIGRVRKKKDTDDDTAMYEKKRGRKEENQIVSQLSQSVS